MFTFLVPVLICYSCTASSNPVDKGDSTQTSFTPTRISGSPYPVSQCPDTLFAVDESNFSDSQLLAIHTLQGIVAQSKPRIFVFKGSDGNAVWLNELQKTYGIRADYTYQSDFKGLINKFKGYVSGYIITTLTEPAAYVALSMSGIKKAIAVTSLDEQTLKDLGLTKIEDVTNQDYATFYNKYNNEINKNIICLQTNDKLNFLGDYAAFAKSMYYHGTLNSSISSQVFSGLSPNAALFGWDGEFNLVKTASQNSIMVHAADYCSNLSVYSNIGVETKQQQHVIDTTVKKDVHTVCFLLTDGDNLQWDIGTLYFNSNWFGSEYRKHANIGWTISPAMCEVAPTILKKFYDNAGTKDGGRDYFVAGPSGLGYMFPEVYPQLESYAKLTNDFMKKSDLSIVNLIGNSMSSTCLTPFASQDQIDAIFFYYYSDYSGGKGKITWINGKPIITGRLTLWKGTFEDPISLSEKINSLSTDITSQSAYSLIPVHVWSTNVSDVVTAISYFNKNVRVVTPDEFVKLIKKNIAH